MQPLSRVGSRVRRPCRSSRTQDETNGVRVSELGDEVGDLEVKPSAATRKGKWYDIDSQRQFFDEAAKALKIQNKEDWYGASSARIGELGGGGLLRAHYDDSLVAALRSVYPEHDWLEWKFKQVRHGFWNDIDNQKKYFDWLGDKLGFTSRSDWYGVSKKIFYENGGSGLLSKKYNDSVHQALKAVYYQHEWLPWRFKQVSKGYWNSRDTQKLFFDWLGTNLGISKYEDWYRVPLKRVMLYAGGKMIMKNYAASLPKALRAIYPEHAWVEWKFLHVTKGFWQDRANRKMFFDEVGKTLGVTQKQGWYSHQAEDLSEFGGKGLMSNFYGDSLPQALADVYPEHQWQPWRFSVAPSRYWRSLATSAEPEKLRAFVTELSQQLGVDSLEDWYRVSPSQVKESGGVIGLKSIGGLRKALKLAYPEHSWVWRRASP